MLRIFSVSVFIYIIGEFAIRAMWASALLPGISYGPIPPSVPNPTVGLKYVPAFRGWRLFQGRKIPFATNDAGYRASRDFGPGGLAIIGDSFVEASEVSEENTFVSRLGADGYGFRGTGPPHYWSRLRYDVLPRKPRFVIVCIFGHNDITDSIPELSWSRHLYPHYVRGADGHIQDIGRYAYLPGTKLFRPFLLLQYLASSLFPVRHPNLDAQTVYAEGSYSQAWRDVEDILKHMKTETLGKMLFVWIPHHVELLDFATNNGPRRRMAEVAGRLGIRFEDSTPALKAAKDDGVEIYIPDDGHFTPASHRVFADWLRPIISELDNAPNRSHISD